MLSGATKIPYAVLFGGDHYMLFTLCPIPGTKLHGLICSDILSTLNSTLPFMPIMVFCLLRAGNVKPPQHLEIPAIDVRTPLSRTRLAAKLATKNSPQDAGSNTLSAVPSTTFSSGSILSKVSCFCFSASSNSEHL